MLDDFIKYLILINPKTPDDALDFIKDDLHKTLGVGSPKSFIEVMKMVPDITKAWASFRQVEDSDAEAQPEDAELPEADDEGEAEEAEADNDGGAKKRRSQAGEETRLWKFLQKTFPGVAESFADFRRIRSNYNTGRAGPAPADRGVLRRPLRLLLQILVHQGHHEDLARDSHHDPQGRAQRCGSSASRHGHPD